MGGLLVEQPNDDLVDIVVIDAGPRRIGVYSIIPRLTKLNIKQARKLVDGAPQSVITRVPRVQAEALKIEMEAFGAGIELRASAGSPGAPTDLL
jgi:large subunit ribosomal protein L7/L12